MTFTVPSELRRLIRSHPRVAYAAMMHAAAEATKELAADKRHLGTSQLGFFSVLHTWLRDGVYHPHVHIVVIGGGVSEDRRKWRSTPQNFFLPEKPLAILYRNKLRASLAKAGLISQVPRPTWQRPWTVDVEAVGDGTQVLRYLAPYLFRVAIGDSQVQDCDWQASMTGARVTLLVRPSGQRKYVSRGLDVEELLRRFLQHVLPSGFQKVRHYGFLNSHSKLSIDAVRWMIAIDRQQLYLLACSEQIVMQRPTGYCCESCGGDMICTMIVLADGRIIAPGQRGHRGDGPRWPTQCRVDST